MVTTILAPVSDSYRDNRGRFLPGCAGGPGNPHSRQIGRLKAALHEALSEDAIAAVALAMLQKAKDGDVAAAKLVLAYAIGKPVAGSAANVVDSEITEKLLAERLRPDELETLLALYQKAEGPA